MKKSLVIATISLLTMGSASVMADNLTIPNTFVAGTKAEAAKVNENFEAIETAVDEHDDKINANTAEIANKADANDVYTKPAVDSMLNDKANLVDVYTKTQVDTSISGINTSLNGKANLSHTHSGNDITSGTVAEPRIDAAIARVNQVVGIVNAATNVDADTLGGNLPSDFASATHTHDSSEITGTIDADALNGQTASDFAPASTTDDLNDLVTAIENGTTGCPSDMVKVGPICVDKYEASVWSAPTDGIQYGDGVAYPCLPNGNDCSLNAANPIYARSVANNFIKPSASITWFQAQQACANVGKRLLTSAEWQMAAAGTPKASCNVSSSAAIAADPNSSCISNWDVINMAGNVNEWVADWIQGTNRDVWYVEAGGTVSGPNTNPAPALPKINSPKYSSGSLGDSFDNDSTFGIQPADSTNFPAAVYRGGGFGGGGIFNFNASFGPSATFSSVGFRCAR